MSVARRMVANVSAEQRPDLAAIMGGAELRRWYWLKEELQGFARNLGVSAAGSKETLTARLVARLDGEPFTEPAPSRTGKTAQLTGPLAANSVIPRGQRCSQVVRAWFVEQVGPSFGFDAAMREFFAHTDGTQTMHDALEYYRATRDQTNKPIDAQFEYNRFTRSWHETHPAGTRNELLTAWREYRAQPIDQRGRI